MIDALGWFPYSLQILIKIPNNFLKLKHASNSVSSKASKIHSWKRLRGNSLYTRSRLCSCNTLNNENVRTPVRSNAWVSTFTILLIPCSARARSRRDFHDNFASHTWNIEDMNDKEIVFIIFMQYSLWRSGIFDFYNNFKSCNGWHEYINKFYATEFYSCITFHWQFQPDMSSTIWMEFSTGTRFNIRHPFVYCCLVASKLNIN